MKKNQLRSLLIEHVVPAIGLDGGILYRDEDIVFLRGHVMLGLAFQRSERSDSFTVEVYIRPLYMAGLDDGLFGIHCGIGQLAERGGSWWELNRSQDEIRELNLLLESIRWYVEPLFSSLQSENDILRAASHKVSGPLLSLGKVLISGDRGDDLALGYIAAWAGNAFLANMLLKRGSVKLTGSDPSHAQRTRELLRNPSELRKHLEQTAVGNRTRCGIDTAPTLASLLQSDPTEAVRAEVRKAMHRHGFTQAGSLVQRDLGELIQVIEIQRDSKSPMGRPLLTISLGVYSKFIGERSKRPLKEPHIDKCHWRERIGNLMPGAKDHWWDVRGVGAANSVAETMVDALEQYGLPAFEEADTLEKLARMWRSGSCRGQMPTHCRWWAEEVRDLFPESS